MIEPSKDEMPFSLSFNGEDITVSQGEDAIYLCPASAEVLAEMILAKVRHHARDQVFKMEDYAIKDDGIIRNAEQLEEIFPGVPVFEVDLPSESQVRQQSSYLFGVNRDALSDKEEDLHDLGGEG